MTYKIYIGATTTGHIIVGAKAMDIFRKDNQLADTERVYGVQIPHRVVALTPDGYRLMTPTSAKNMGYKISDYGTRL